MQPANLGRLHLRPRRRLAQPGNLPAQRQDAGPVRRDAGIRKQLVEAGHLGPQRQRVLRRAPGSTAASRLRRDDSNCYFQ